MKIAVINGNMRHGNTWHCMDMVKQELEHYEEVEIKEFFLPKDLPHFCHGCFSCLLHGEQSCPHAAFVNPIVAALEEADLIILTSSIYALNVSGQMKAALDHLCFMWLSHRPNPKIFNKVGLTVATTAGAGLSGATKTMRNSLKFWGVKKIFTFKSAVAASSWDAVTDRKKVQLQKKSARLAREIVKAVRHIDKLPSPLFRTFMFRAMAKMMKNNTWSACDRAHWESNGWLDGKMPF